MKQPNALIIIQSQKEIAFRLQKIPYRQFGMYLAPFKQCFPHMRWNPYKRQWHLSVDDLQRLYETCRLMFHPFNVRIVSDDYNVDKQAIQLSLFGKESD
ncbi:MAG: hypothetical protein R3C14_07780 [Caldilineaceae bacterium]